MTERPITLTQAVRALRTDERTPVDLLEHCLARIEMHEPAVQAWVEVDRRAATAQATRQSAMPITERAQLPLAGIPFGIKDIIDVQGLPTRAGSSLRANHRAERDAPIVTRLRELGAIILGKTHTTQFACQDPSPTRNPWNLAHTPGGSSSGSAAAVASGMCIAALGTQTGGSITRPATFCGVASFKGSWGCWPLDGIVPVSHGLDHVGPHTPATTDLSLLWRLMGYGAAGSPNALSRQLSLDTVLAGTHLDDYGPPTLYSVEQYFKETSDLEAWTVYEGALGTLRDAGATIRTLTLPESFADMHRSQGIIMAVEAAAYHRADFERAPETYAPGVSKVVEKGLSHKALEYHDALEHQARFRSDFRQALLTQRGTGPAIAVTPATVSAAPPLTANSTGDPQFNAIWSFSGLPTCAFPAGLTPQRLPVGIQLGAANESDALFLAANWCERALGFVLNPPIN